MERLKTGKRIRNTIHEDVNQVAAKELEKLSIPSFRKGDYSPAKASVMT